MCEPDNLLQAAENILGILAKHSVDAVVIGAVALAAHRYIRQTEDLDFGVNASLPMMRKLADSLNREGFQVELREPDMDDPLGGVIDIRGDFGLVKIVNFGERFPAVIDDAVQTSTLFASEGSLMRVVPLPHLIALKLYAGGHKSKADILELIARNPEFDLDQVRKLCESYRLQGLDKLLADL